MLMTKIAGSGSRSGSESGFRSRSVSQRHGSADPDLDPDPHQNVMDPLRWLKVDSVFFLTHHCMKVQYISKVQ